MQAYKIKCGSFEDFLRKLPIDVLKGSDKIPVGDLRESVLDLDGNLIYDLSEAIKEAKAQFGAKEWRVSNGQESHCVSGETPVKKPFGALSPDGMREFANCLAVADSCIDRNPNDDLLYSWEED